MALIDALRNAAETAGISLLCDAHMTELFAYADNRVLGLRVERPDGSQEDIGCDVLLLVCNGYGGNKQLVAQHIHHLPMRFTSPSRQPG